MFWVHPSGDFCGILSRIWPSFSGRWTNQSDSRIHQFIWSTMWSQILGTIEYDSIFEQKGPFCCQIKDYSVVTMFSGLWWTKQVCYPDTLENPDTGFRKFAKLTIFGISINFCTLLLSTQIVNGVCNVEWDFFCNFQTLCFNFQVSRGFDVRLAKVRRCQRQQ